jgi:NADPH-dependent curcumin reductase CurA
MSQRTREIHLASRPSGWPTQENFRLVDVELPDLASGEVLVRNTVMSVDPYMRGRMNEGRSYIAPFGLGAALDGGAVGEVIASTDESVVPGDVVLHDCGWREHVVLPATRVKPVDTNRAPASAYLGVLGMPGLTAYVGLVRIAELRAGDTVFVSGAAGAVGSAVGQIARNLGAARVIGSAGSAAKVSYLIDELGFDAAFDYHDATVAEQLDRLAPNGIDVYFDNVGGDHLEGALSRMRDFGRIAMCGAISIYNADEPVPGPRNVAVAITRRLKMQGFIVFDHADVEAEYVARATEWISAGTLKYQETVVNGLERAPDALLDLHKGTNVGKMLVLL